MTDSEDVVTEIEGGAVGVGALRIGDTKVTLPIEGITMLAVPDEVPVEEGKTMLTVPAELAVTGPVPVKIADTVVGIAA